MALWGEDDTFGRWLQFAFSIPLLLLGGGLVYHDLTVPYSERLGGPTGGIAGTAMFILGLRCLWYGVTGRDNVNRDNF